MPNKEITEQLIACEFLKRHYKADFEETDVSLGDHTKQEPDILYRDTGLELGALLSKTNTEVEKFETEFFIKTSNQIKGKIHPNFLLKLVMQDEREIVEYSPKAEFTRYKYLPKYISGIFVHFCENPPDYQIQLNQMSSMRIPTYPNPNSRKVFGTFVNELGEFINNIDPKTFQKEGHDNGTFYGRSICRHYMICDGKVVRKPSDPIDLFFPESIIAKFRFDKYRGNFSQKFLVLHNYNPIQFNSFTSDIHFYQHYRDNIFNRISDYIDDYKSFRIYDGIFFLDFSLSPDLKHAKSTDFKLYENVELRANPRSEGQMRVSFRPLGT